MLLQANQQQMIAIESEFWAVPGPWSGCHPDSCMTQKHEHIYSSISPSEDYATKTFYWPPDECEHEIATYMQEDDDGFRVGLDLPRRAKLDQCLADDGVMDFEAEQTLDACSRRASAAPPLASLSTALSVPQVRSSSSTRSSSLPVLARRGGEVARSLHCRSDDPRRDSLAEANDLEAHASGSSRRSASESCRSSCSRLGAPSKLCTRRASPEAAEIVDREASCGLPESEFDCIDEPRPILPFPARPVLPSGLASSPKAAPPIQGASAPRAMASARLYLPGAELRDQVSKPVVAEHQPAAEGNPATWNPHWALVIGSVLFEH